MQLKHTNITSYWGYLIVEELIRQGIDYFCISPGSRSTPLTVAVAENKKAKSIICIDERAAAFHALGYAKATGNPAVLICTSGTAVANYYPAIIEAKKTGMSLLILSADRPPELRDSGANQTIDQNRIFGNYVKWYFELPVPDLNIKPEFLLTTIDQAVSQVKMNKKGSVHINCMFREPLEPLGDGFNTNYTEKIRVWESGSLPYTQLITGIAEINSDELGRVASKINTAQSGIIAIGSLSNDAQKNDVIALSKKMGWPVFADISSGLQSSSLQNNIAHYDQILLKKDIGKILSPDVILHIGSTLTSKRFLTYTAAQKNKTYIHITDDHDRNDPVHQVTQRVTGNISEICRDLTPQVNPNQNKDHDIVISFDKKINGILDELFSDDHAVTEISTARIISQYLPRKHGLFLGNSMPIRDFDMFADFTYAPVCVGSNRGASGIDGTLASATGFATGHDKPVTVVLGDLAQIHDLNSLSLVKTIDTQIILIVINNQGGGIFSFLPIAEFDQVFERYFATPHQINFRQAAGLFAMDYANPKTNEELTKIYNEYIQNRKSIFLEIRTNRQENIELHKEIQNKITSNF